MMRRNPSSSSVPLSDEPLLPPMISRVPAPFDFPERPVLSVPDVSLLMDSSMPVVPNLPNNTPKSLNSSTSLSSSRLNGSSGTVPPPMLNLSSSANSILEEGTNKDRSSCSELNISGRATLTEDLKRKLEEQEGTIKRIEEKLDKIVEFQDVFLSKLFQKGQMVDIGVQAEIKEETLRLKSPAVPVSSASGSQTCGTSTSLPSHSSTPQPRSSSNASRKSGSAGYREKDDVSGILNLKDVELPTLHEPSAMYSEIAGLKSLPLEEFNEESLCSYDGSDGDSPVFDGAPKSGGNNSRSRNDSACSSEGSGGRGFVPLMKFKPQELSKNPSQGSGSGSSNSSSLNDSGHRGQRQSESPIYARDCENAENGKFRRDVNFGQIRNENEPPGNSGNQYRYSPTPPVTKSDTRPLALKNYEYHQPQHQPQATEGNAVVVKTKQYLESLGVKFGYSPTSDSHLPVGVRRENARNHNNYMIQQNVYNSIYIPTVNCAPVIPEAIDYAGSNSEYSSINALAQKYVSPEDRREFEAIRAPLQSERGPGTETIYGMTQSNLSFATEEYLRRYGLVNGENGNVSPHQVNPPPANSSPQYPPRLANPIERVQFLDARQQYQQNPGPRHGIADNDRILNVTAIRSQPMLE